MRMRRSGTVSPQANGCPSIDRAGAAGASLCEHAVFPLRLCPDWRAGRVASMRFMGVLRGRGGALWGLVGPASAARSSWRWVGFGGALRGVPPRRSQRTAGDSASSLVGGRPQRTHLCDAPLVAPGGAWWRLVRRAPVTRPLHEAPCAPTEGRRGPRGCTTHLGPCGR